MDSKFLKHSILFHLSWASIFLVELYFLKYKLILLVAIPLIFVLAHLIYFSNNFLKDLIYISLSFLMGFSAEAIMSNADIYHFGIVDYPGFVWPPQWVASLWLMFPIYLVHSWQILNKQRVVGAYTVAFFIYATYAYLGESLDLVFFHLPKIQSAVFFVLVWYLMARVFFWTYKKLSSF